MSRRPTAPRSDTEAVIEGTRWAVEEAARLLEPLGDRWAHTRAVGEKAVTISGWLEYGDACALVAAAYLHDVGYAPALAETGFHPLDGARYLRNVGRERIAALVAHHSASRFEADLRGLSDELRQFLVERSGVPDALTYCDVTTSPDGADMTLSERAAEVIERYGQSHGVSKSIRAALPSLLAAVRRTEALLDSSTGPA